MNPKDPNTGERPPRAPRPHQVEAGKATYRLDVGRDHGVQPKNIIGAIANEADLDSRHMGRLTIRDHFSLIDLPEGMPRELLQHLKKVRVAGRPLQIRLDGDKDKPASKKTSTRKSNKPNKPSSKKAKRKDGKKPARQRR